MTARIAPGERGCYVVAAEFNGLVGDVAEAVKCAFKDNLASIAIFGSTARGDELPTSDIDVLVIAAGIGAGHHHVSSSFRQALESLIHDLRRRGRHTRSVIKPAWTPDGMELTMSVDGTATAFVFEAVELRRLTTLYLSLCSDVVVLFEKDKYLTRRIQLAKSLMSDMRDERIPFGAGWYWRPGKLPTETRLAAFGFRSKEKWLRKWATFVLDRTSFGKGPAPPALQRKYEYLRLRGSLAAKGVEPVKCNPWIHLIPRREVGLFATQARRTWNRRARAYGEADCRL